MRRAFLISIATWATAAMLVSCAATAAPREQPSADSSDSLGPIATNRIAIPEDATAFQALGVVAPGSLKLEGGTVTSTACWTPSEHLFRDLSIASATTWKVLCRVYYSLNGASRYQDATCIGDFAATPMLDHCYVWEYYTYEPQFADGDRLASPAPSAAP